MASLEENKAIVLRWGEVWHQDTLDDLDALFAPDFIDHALSSKGRSGLNTLKAHCRLLKDAFPDLTFAYQHLIAEGALVVMHWLASGTHQEEFLDCPATGRRIYWHGCTIFRVVQEKIMERWTYHDSDSLIKQLRGDTIATS